jgi:hypothetical protein
VATEQASALTLGPEYDRVVEESGGRGRAEANLQNLEKRVQTFDIKPLSTTERDRFLMNWRDVQANFVDNPEIAVTREDQLLNEVCAWISGRRLRPVGRGSVGRPSGGGRQLPHSP